MRKALTDSACLSARGGNLLLSNLRLIDKTTSEIGWKQGQTDNDQTPGQPSFASKDTQASRDCSFSPPLAGSRKQETPFQFSRESEVAGSSPTDLLLSLISKRAKKTPNLIGAFSTYYLLTSFIDTGNNVVFSKNKIIRLVLILF